MNIGNLLYVSCALAGGVFMLSGLKNIGIRALFDTAGLVFSIDMIVPFLNMTKQFTGNVNQLSQQINAVVMAMAGAKRVFDLMDQQPETDDGYVTLVNAKLDKLLGLRTLERRAVGDQLHSLAPLLCGGYHFHDIGVDEGLAHAAKENGLYAVEEHGLIHYGQYSLKPYVPEGLVDP